MFHHWPQVTSYSDAEVKKQKKKRKKNISKFQPIVSLLKKCIFLITFLSKSWRIPKHEKYPVGYLVCCSVKNASFICNSNTVWSKRLSSDWGWLLVYQAKTWKCWIRRSCLIIRRKQSQWRWAGLYKRKKEVHWAARAFYCIRIFWKL